MSEQPGADFFEPFVVVAAQRREQPCARQRRLSTTRSPEDHDETRKTLTPYLIEQLDAFANFVVATEEDRSIPLLEGAQTRIWMICGAPFPMGLRRDSLDSKTIPMTVKSSFCVFSFNSRKCRLTDSQAPLAVIPIFLWS